MLRWVGILLPLGLVVGLLGLGGLAIAAAGFAKTLIVFFVTAFALSLVILALAVRSEGSGRPSEPTHPTTDGALAAGTRSLSD